jgi:hypothetical protein
MNLRLIISLCLAIVPLTHTGAALPPALVPLVSEAGNASTEEARIAAIERMAALPGVDAQLRDEAKALTEVARAWMGAGLAPFQPQPRNPSKKAIGDYDFKVAADSPLRPLTHLYRGRILAWMLIQDSSIRGNAELSRWFKDEAMNSFRLASAAFPENRIARMYLGEPIPWPKEYAAVPGAPKWAVLQRESVDRLREIIHWWIDERQQPDGFFGGGRGYDCEMWRWWSSLLIGFDDPKIRKAQLKTSRSAINSGDLKTAGFNTQIMDVEHAAEDTTDNLIPLLLLDPAEPRWTQHARRLVDMMRDVWTGRNECGQLQFKSFYYSATAVAPQPQRAFDVMANIGALHPAMLVWQRSGDPALGETICMWLDTWVDATARAENGKPAGVLPASIRWPDGAVAGSDGRWWEPVKPGGYMYGYYLWPSVLTEMADAFLLAHVMTGQEKYLAPLRSMAAIRLRYLKSPSATPAVPGSEEWCAQQLAPRTNANSSGSGLVKTLARARALTGTHEFDELIALESGEFVVRSDAAGRRDLEAALRASFETLRVNFAGFTSEVKGTDRVLRFVQFLAQD